MSKLVRDLQYRQWRNELTGAADMLFVNVVGLNGHDSTRLRLDLRKKGIHLRVVRNRIVHKVFDELGAAQTGPTFRGSSAVAWGGAGIVELAKEITGWTKKLQKLQIKGGLVAGQIVDSSGVEQLSKLPAKAELLGRVSMLITASAARVAALIVTPAGKIVAQLHALSDAKTPAAESASQPTA